jgi:radical SAM protein with 4Fe4S-binding SPASM domain
VARSAGTAVAHPNLMTATLAVPLPRFVQIEPVGLCNLRCRMCPIQFRVDANDASAALMDYDMFCRLVDQFPELEELHLQGLGEPLLHPRFFDMVRYAARHGVEVSTNTNLTALSDRRAQDCVRSGLARMHVSLDGATAKTYEFIRTGARFRRVLRNLKRVVDAKTRIGSALPRIYLVAVAMRKNLHELPAMVRLAARLGIDTLSVQYLCHDFTESSLPVHYLPMRDFVDREMLLHEDEATVARIFEQARRVASRLGVSLRLPNTRPRPRSAALKGRARCDWPWRGSYLSYSGEAMPCCMVATPDRINFGNMERSGVAAIWNNDSYTLFRERLESDSPPEICRSCAVYNGTF